MAYTKIKNSSNVDVILYWYQDLNTSAEIDAISPGEEKKWAEIYPKIAWHALIEPDDSNHAEPEEEEMLLNEVLRDNGAAADTVYDIV